MTVLWLLDRPKSFIIHFPFLTRYFPGNFEEGGEGNLTSRSDRFAMLSVARDASELDTLPLLLVIFVCLVAALLGMVVAGLHSMIKYVGCPLGVNGCNSFSGADYEKKGFILIKALEDYMPEDLVYVLMAMVSLFLIGAIVEVVPESYGKQEGARAQRFKVHSLQTLGFCHGCHAPQSHHDYPWGRLNTER